ncbi:23891_t:CDS:2, partial [Gigaspora margarita]
ITRVKIELDEFLSMVNCSDNWEYIRQDLKYNLARSEGKNYRDMDYVSLKHYGVKKKKGECEDVIMKQYRENLFNIKNKKPVHDYYAWTPFFSFEKEESLKEFNYCVKTAIRTKVLFPDGSIFKKRCGIISGTMGTLLINSLLNTIGCLTIMSMMEEIDIDLMEHGDCNCVTNQCPNNISFKLVFQVIYYWLGKDINIRGYDNVFKLFKDVWNIDIPSFNADTLKDISLELMKYALITGNDFKFSTIKI